MRRTTTRHGRIAVYKTHANTNPSRTREPVRAKAIGRQGRVRIAVAFRPSKVSPFGRFRQFKIGKKRQVLRGASFVRVDKRAFTRTARTRTTYRDHDLSNASVDSTGFYRAGVKWGENRRSKSFFPRRQRRSCVIPSGTLKSLQYPPGAVR